MKISIPKQIALLQKNIVKIFNYQLSTLLYQEDGSIYLIIEPSDGYWKGGRYPFSIYFPDDFPDDPPNVISLDEEILHPNISNDGSVCLNIIGDDWNSSLGIEDIIQGLLFLFYEPAPDDALTDAFYGYYGKTETFEEFVSRKVKDSIDVQRDKRLAMMDYENNYVLNLSKSIVSEVIQSQVDYQECIQTTNNINRKHSKNYESEFERNEDMMRKFISI